MKPAFEIELVGNWVHGCPARKLFFLILRQLYADLVRNGACQAALQVEDIDIRRSPAGGYHVSYLNNLAEGKNDAEKYDSNTDGTASEEMSSEEQKLSKRL